MSSLAQGSQSGDASFLHRRPGRSKIIPRIRIFRSLTEHLSTESPPGSSEAALSPLPTTNSMAMQRSAPLFACCQPANGWRQSRAILRSMAGPLNSYNGIQLPVVITGSKSCPKLKINMASAFKCRSCRQRINVSPHQMGQSIVCPMCKTEQTVDLGMPPGQANVPAASNEGSNSGAPVPVQAVEIASSAPSVPTASAPATSMGRDLQSTSSGGVNRFGDPGMQSDSSDGSGGLLMTIGCFVIIAGLFAVLGVALYMLLT